MIHYWGLSKDKSTARIRTDRVEDVRKGGRVEVVRYALAFPPDEVVRRARSRLDENGYDLFGNNCEHYARWCMTGEQISSQTDRIGAAGGGASAGAAVTAGSVAGVVAIGGAARLAGGASVMRGLAAVGRVGGAGAAGGLLALTVAPAVVANAAVRKAFRDDQMLDEEERRARKAARDTTAVTSALGAAGSLAVVSAAGVPGLSAVGITTGLASIGATVGGGMIAGVALALLGPALLAGVVGVCAYHLKRALSPRQPTSSRIQPRGVPRAKVGTAALARDPVDRKAPAMRR